MQYFYPLSNMFTYLSYFIYFILVFLIFVLTFYGFTTGITIIWLKITDNLLLPYSLIDVLDSLPGLYTFAFILIIIANSLSSLHNNKITLSKKFISWFKSPEKALTFWLNSQFVFSLFTGIILIYFSATNFCSLLGIDILLMAKSIDYSYENVVIEFQQIYKKIAEVVTPLFILSFSAFVLAFLAKNHKFVAFLQALFLIVIVGICLFISFFYCSTITMLGFTDFLLIGSITACLISLLDNYILSFLNVSFLDWFHKQIKEKTKFKTSLKNKYDSPKQYLLSYLLFLSYSSLLNWCFLFYSNIEHFNEIENQIMWFCLITGIWLFLAFRFALLSANIIKKPVIIPLAPVIIAAIYIRPLLETFFSSFSSFSLSYGKFYSFFYALYNPTYILSKNLQGSITETSIKVTFAASSPAESFGPILLEGAKEAGSFVKNIIKGDWTDRAVGELETSTRALQTIEKTTDNPQLKSNTEEVLTNIYALQDKHLPLEQKMELTSSTKKTLLVMVNKLDICRETLGSPKSGLVRSHNIGKCLEFAAKTEARAADASSSLSTSAIAETLVNLTENL